jgi:hypothetical protein
MMPWSTMASFDRAGSVIATFAASFCLLMSPSFVHAQSDETFALPSPHWRDLQSMRAELLSDQARAYRLIWHAWHKKPGILTLQCDPKECSAELRHTDGYGTYRQGTLEDIFIKRVERTKAMAVMDAISAGGVWSLPPQVRVEKGERVGLPEDSKTQLCLHAPYYYIEAKDSGRSLMAYRYCQSNYMDGLKAMAPLIVFFDELFPEQLAKVKPTPATASTKIGESN